ncbi:hypothetical protein AKJ40_00775 [candidate division MSBL1 archaeon SCGC-AAA259M10]|uniref:Uncharacterized protein n=2 Tax=candidate division MSBL1 TaxID=215777 RepID=A0A133U854_9EURY|nr:hypothetical protein AKJ61_00860 [candidate division MSBL1 archaeon SCGC-AAA259B11]KXB00726.1 hypothetical protein AKJ40_00775 [candidate division MSBL1 archaeon SCGC-AAA259M10]
MQSRIESYTEGVTSGPTDEYVEEKRISPWFPFPHSKVGSRLKSFGCGAILVGGEKAERVELAGPGWRRSVCEKAPQWKIWKKEWGFSVLVCTSHTSPFRVGRIEQKAKRDLENGALERAEEERG